MIDWKLLNLIEDFLRNKWRRVKYIRAGKPLKSITTMDLDSEGKLKPNYLEDREQRKKKRKEAKVFDSIDIDF